MMMEMMNDENIYGDMGTGEGRNPQEVEMDDLAMRVRDKR